MLCNPTVSLIAIPVYTLSPSKYNYYQRVRSVRTLLPYSSSAFLSTHNVLLWPPASYRDADPSSYGTNVPTPPRTSALHRSGQYARRAMTSNNFGEPTWLQRADLAFVKPAKPASLASRSFPRQSLDDVVPSPAYSGDTHRLAHKRRNLEGYSSNANPSLLFESSRLPLSERASGSGDQTLPPIPTSETPFPSSHRQGKDTSKRKQSKSPCLPLQPEKHPRCSVTGALDRSVGQKFALKRGVSIKPYVAERPSLAPRFNSSGKACKINCRH